MQQLDSRLALGNMRTVDDQVSDSLSNERLIALLSVSFGPLAILLAAIGLYGVLAYSTAQRTREIGIRMALGAQRTSVVRLVLQDVLWIAGISIVATLPISLLLGRMLRSELYGVSAGDPWTLMKKCSGKLRPPTDRTCTQSVTTTSSVRFEPWNSDHAGGIGQIPGPGNTGSPRPCRERARAQPRNEGTRQT